VKLSLSAGDQSKLIDIIFNKHLKKNRPPFYLVGGYIDYFEPGLGS
jgi:hypothetical protein